MRRVMILTRKMRRVMRLLIKGLFPSVFFSHSILSLSPLSESMLSKFALSNLELIELDVCIAINILNLFFLC